MFIPLTASAQNFVYSTTNYYSVTGANFREIRQSIARARPWKDSFDGDTRWQINWKFNLTPTAAGCSWNSFSTTTTIKTTLPRWFPPPDVLPHVKEQWTRYFTNLAQHEAGHARIAIAAATEIHKRIAEIGSQSNCQELRNQINQRADAIVEEHREREKDYDRRTDHGRNVIGGR